MRTINDSHLMYGSWDMKCNRQNFLTFWTIFCPFTPLTIRKIKILKKWNKVLEILSFYTCVPYMTIIWCMVPEKWSVTGRIFIIFDCFLLFYLPDNPKTQNFEKLKKTPRDIIILHMCIINNNQMMYGSWNIKRNRQNFLLFWTIFSPFTN